MTKIITRKLVLLLFIIILLNFGFVSINAVVPTDDITINTTGTELHQINENKSEEIVTFTVFIPVVLNVDSYNNIKLPTLESFAESLINGQSEIIRGVYIQDVMALRVVQQPDGDPNFIDNTPDATTQFHAAAQFGTIGLLAHNDRAGMYFYSIKIQHNITIIYGDGSTDIFRVKDIKRFQALTPYDPYSRFIDMETGKVLTSSDLFRLVYSSDQHLTLQTCIDNLGVPTWGRLFVLAELTSISR